MFRKKNEGMEKQLAMVGQLKDVLTNAVMVEVGNRIVEAQQKQQKELNDKLMERMNDFEKSMDATLEKKMREKVKAWVTEDIDKAVEPIGDPNEPN